MRLIKSPAGMAGLSAAGTNCIAVCDLLRGDKPGPQMRPRAFLAHIRIAMVRVSKSKYW